MDNFSCVMSACFVYSYYHHPFIKETQFILLYIHSVVIRIYSLDIYAGQMCHVEINQSKLNHKLTAKPDSIAASWSDVGTFNNIIFSAHIILSVHNSTCLWVCTYDRIMQKFGIWPLLSSVMVPVCIIVAIYGLFRWKP